MLAREKDTCDLLLGDCTDIVSTIRVHYAQIPP